MPTSEVLVIGAGPFGLSISTHLRGLGVDHRIVGRPMDAWRSNMPVGMNLKSDPYCSDMSSPQSGYDLAGYCRSHGIDGLERLRPLPLETFLDYADWYTKQLVPDVTDVTVTEVKAVDGGFQVTFADAEPVAARQVVIATGILPHFHIPTELSGLPSELVSHTSDHHRFDRFRGRRVAVVGSGQSALETAAALHGAGAETYLVARRPDAPVFPPNPGPRTLVQRIRRPLNKLCGGWKCQVWNSTFAFRRLPPGMRVTTARSVLGPSGTWWLKERIEGKVEVLSGHQVRGAESSESYVRLLLDGPNRSGLEIDHVIAGTGFRIDLARLAFLPEALRARIATLSGYPVLTRAGESTVAGLYFVGAPAAASLGPSMRFVAGTHSVSSQLARSVARRSKASRGDLAASEARDHALQSSDYTASVDGI